MTNHRGFGVSALITPEFVQPLAQAAELEGYSTFWVNDVPGGNGLEQLARAQAVTSRMLLGVGVLPVDRWTCDTIIREVDRLRLNPERLVLGVGSGARAVGALEATAAASLGLKAAGMPHVLVGAMGPAMCELAGRNSDGVILNWLAPRGAPAMIQLVQAGALGGGRTDPTIVAYVRTACHPAANDTLRREADSYQNYPAYARHFARMGVNAIDTTINGMREEISARFDAFPVEVDEVVARAIAQDDSLAGSLAVLSASSPLGG